MAFKKIVVLSLLLMPLFFSNPVLALSGGVNTANDWYFHSKGYGWFWYQKTPEKKKNKLKKPAAVSVQSLRKMDAVQLKKYLKKVKLIAVGSPTYQNVKNYITVQDYAAYKSRKFARMWRLVMYKNPALDYYASHGVGSSSYANIIKEEITHNEKVKIIEKLRPKAVIAMFYNPSSPLTAQTMERLKVFHKEYGFNYVFINALTHKKTAKRLGVIKLPEAYLVVNNKGKIKHYFLFIGLHSIQTIGEKIAYVYKNIINPAD
ncbi:MAG: conjugal transfer protein TraF [Deltaproteobacteria bacterium]|jgi:hypothetical protein|nr:conjugal transfer protein TraF [Deltaproteobacteria bacterium]